MKRRQKLRVNIYDETHLINKASFHINKIGLILTVLGFAAIFTGIGMCIVVFSPVKDSLPGYLKEEQRDDTQENIVQLDSMRKAMEENQAYIDNFFTLLDTDREPSDSAMTMPDKIPVALSPDSLLGASEEEKEFVRIMQAKEKYNISVIAPLASEGVKFHSLNPEAIFTKESKGKTIGEVIFPKGSSIQSAAEGKVIEASSPNLNSLYTIVIQHPNGFLSKLSGCGTPLVTSGETVGEGQPIALLPANGKHPNRIKVELWHNGTPLIPSKYLNSKKDYDTK